MQEKFYISTPIYYPSNKLHIGNSYTTVLADYVARYQRLLGKEVFFLTGTDEHGQKIEKIAKEKGLAPLEFTNDIVAWIKELWQKLDVSYDYYIRTTDADHCQRVQAIFQKLYDQGDIYKGVYKGWYCTPCETFWTETQISEDKLCPDCNRAVEKAEEECYFFRLSKYQKRLLQLYHDNPNFLVPSSRVNEMVKNFIEPGLQDLAVSRTSFAWGVPVPFDPKHVIYVWIDALSNYITALHYPEEELPEIWQNSLQLLGKDIARFHAIIWPALLMALNLPLPKQLYAHGWLMFKDDKMSKSKGNMVDPMVLTERYGVDPIRYYLLSELPFGGDGHFSNESLIERINIHLANDLGNLYSRSVAMFVKYFAGQIPSDLEATATEFDSDLEIVLQKAVDKYHQCIRENQHANSLAAIFTLIRRANKYIDETCPWLLAKDDSKKAELLSVMLHLLEVLRQVALCLYPAMPKSMLTMLAGLGQKTELANLIEMFKTVGTWQAFKTESVLSNAKPLFPRLDMDKEIDYLNGLLEAQKSALENKKQTTVKAASKENTSIEFADFLKLDLRVGTVLTCEKVKGADKLLHEVIDLGELGERHVVSGIAEYYQPADLIGQQVVVLCNLPERKLKGIKSQAMVLTAVDAEQRIRIIKPAVKVNNGSKIS